jgi:hypothetical protein
MKIFTQYFLLFLLLYFLYSCKNEQALSQESPSEIKPLTLEVENSSLPHLFSNGETLLLSFVTETDTLATLYYSELIDNQWSTPEAITSGSDWFVNWADYPQIAKNGKNYIAHILQKSDTATFAYDVMVTQKQEGGSWSTPFKIHSDTTKTEHGFVSYAPFGESQFLVNWLDGRNTSGGHHDHGGEPMTLRAAIVNPDGSIENEYLLDDSVCDCCQTSSVMTANGSVVVYRDRSDEEIRDISIVRFEDGKWSAPVSVYHDKWQIHGCPVNGPQVTSLNENVAVIWFTAAGMENRVNLAFSKNSGTDFETPIRIDTGEPLGRVDISFIDTENVVVSWMEDEGDETFIKFRKVNLNGQLGEIFTLANTSDSRASGFPQMAVLNGNVYFAWTSFEDDRLLVKTKFIDIDTLQ